MRILGIDFGEKRIGVAVSDPLGFTAQSVAVVGKGESFDDDVREIKKIIKKFEGIDEIVVGLPKTLSGEIGISAKKTLEFVDHLKNNFKVPITTWDERLTTVLASRALSETGMSVKKQRSIIDKSAATFILQSYLESKRK